MVEVWMTNRRTENATEDRLLQCLNILCLCVVIVSVYRRHRHGIFVYGQHTSTSTSSHSPILFCMYEKIVSHSFYGICNSVRLLLCHTLRSHSHFSSYIAHIVVDFIVVHATDRSTFAFDILRSKKAVLIHNKLNYLYNKNVCLLYFAFLSSARSSVFLSRETGSS